MAETRAVKEQPHAAGLATSPGFVQRVLIVVGILLAVLAVLFLAWFGIRVWLILFAGVLLAIFLRTLGNWVSQYTPVPQRWSLAVVIPLLIGLVTLAGWLLAPSISEQFQELFRRLPDALNRLSEQLQQWTVVRWLSGQMPPAAEVASTVGDVASRLAGFFRITMEVLVGVLVIGFLGLYLAANPQTYIDGLVRLFPKRRRERIHQVLDEIGCAIRYWLLGQLASMVAVGTLVGLGLWIAGIPLPLALGVIAGVLEFIPVFGPIIAAVPAVLLGLTQSPMQALWAALIFFGVQQIEGHLIYPLAQKYALSLPPGLTVAALALGGTLFGFLGLLLATPITAVCMVLVKRLYLEDVLGDPVNSSSCD